ncbi:MAG: anaerobic sulfatase maturase [Candidatus Limnocylindrales bacterium]
MSSQPVVSGPVTPSEEQRHDRPPNPGRHRCDTPFVVMAKPVGPVCNLECSYCYYLDKTGSYGPRHTSRMSDELLERFVRQYIEASPGPLVHFVWHGGEPTLAGLSFFRRAVELQRRFLPEGFECWNNLQTNGTLLDEAWCAFLAAEHFDVGLSIDGTAALHDAHRRDRRGRGSFERATAALERLRRHGVRPDLLCTVTSTAAKDPLGTYRAMAALGGFVQFLPIVRRGADGKPTPDSVSPEGWGRFLCEAFDEWVRRDLPDLAVQVFLETLRAYAGAQPLTCVMAPTCGRVVVLEHDGAVYSCDHFVDRQHRLGNIADEHLGALVDRPEQYRFGDDKRNQLPAKCRSCPWLSVCNGWCPKDRFARTEDGEPGLSYLCDGFRAFFSHADGRLRRIAELGGQGRSPAVIMAALREEESARRRGVHRNDPCPCGSGKKAKRCCFK